MLYARYANGKNVISSKVCLLPAGKFRKYSRKRSRKSIAPLSQYLGEK